MKITIGDEIKLNDSAISYGIPAIHYAKTHIITEILGNNVEYKYPNSKGVLCNWFLREIDFELVNQEINLFKFC